jgi:hypothetical protein
MTIWVNKKRGKTKTYDFMGGIPLSGTTGII